MAKSALFLFLTFVVLACAVVWGQAESKAPPTPAAGQDLAQLKARAQGGELSAQLALAQAYFLGLGIPKDEAEGVRWFVITAGRGEPQSQRILGLLYELGGAGLAKDEAQAASWFQKAAAQGDAVAQYKLGRVYETGRGLTQDLVLALAWYRKAAQQGSAPAQSSLGTMYQDGRGVAKSEVEALSWYRKAADQGDSEAQNRAALLCITSANPEVRDPNAGLNYALAANAQKRDPLYRSTLARAYSLEGRLEEAVRAQTEAVELAPPDKKTEYQQILLEYQQALNRSKAAPRKSTWSFPRN